MEEVRRLLLEKDETVISIHGGTQWISKLEELEKYKSLNFSFISACLVSFEKMRTLGIRLRHIRI